MGTNYYAYKKPTQAARKHLCQLIETSDDYQSIKNEVYKMYGEVKYDFDENGLVGGVVHLGKMSYGWKFLWNCNWRKVYHGHSELVEVEGGVKHYTWVEDPPTVSKIYDLTKESISEFVHRDDIEIYDEYGEKQDKDEFLKMAFDLTQGRWDSISYYESQIKKGKKPYLGFHNEYVRFLESQGLKMSYTYNDFYSDGLRFSTSLDFS